MNISQIMQLSFVGLNVDPTGHIFNIVVDCLIIHKFKTMLHLDLFLTI